MSSFLYTTILLLYPSTLLKCGGDPRICKKWAASGEHKLESLQVMNRSPYRVE
jgi:hypothetical protein